MITNLKYILHQQLLKLYTSYFYSSIIFLKKIISLINNFMSFNKSEKKNNIKSGIIVRGKGSSLIYVDVPTKYISQKRD